MISPIEAKLDETEQITPNVDLSPYYIVSPSYTRLSAGIRCLHLLCHWLNRNGQRAFIVSLGSSHGFSSTSPDLLTPLLTEELLQHHYEQQRPPIVVYPETIAGNPLNAECVVRWLLNYPGLLGGDIDFSKEEQIWAFSEVLALAVKPKADVLHLPALDQRTFHPGEPRKRSGFAFYAAKYADFHGGEIFRVPNGAIEITRGKPDSQDPDEIAEILRSVELLYVFENTALATEAVLCGCPVVFMPNKWLKEAIAAKELGWEGYAWGDKPSEIARARITVEKGRENYFFTVLQFHDQLVKFIDRSQERAATMSYVKKIPSHFVATPPVPVPSEYPMLDKIPIPISREIGKLFCTLGRASQDIGNAFWKSAHGKGIRKNGSP